MHRNSIQKKMITIIITALLILLIFLTCIPPATAVYLHPGNPDDTLVDQKTKITFEDVTLTIRGPEKIPSHLPQRLRRFARRPVTEYC